MKRFLDFISSLRLTVFCLTMALIVTFVGTLAQVKLGLWVAQEQYFRSIFVWWGPEGAGWKIPVLPGGWLLGGLLLINLLAAHAKRFKPTRRKTGIFLIHFGLILLLVGQFMTEVFQVESVMAFRVGQSKNYSESQRVSELAIIDTTDPANDKVVAIPQESLAPGKEITHPDLPFTLKIKDYAVNSVVAPPRVDSPDKLTAPQGIGQKLHLAKRPYAAAMDADNFPVALVEVASSQGAVGTWLVSPWVTDSALLQEYQLRTGLFDLYGTEFNAAQKFEHEGRTYEIALRPKRYYKPYSITLNEARHEIYTGTEIPRDFRSSVTVNNPQTSETRPVVIYMNNPLRYDGETYYQFQMGGGGPDGKAQSSALQVVRNPAWLTPYLACTLVGVGLVVQFMMHLVGFAKKRMQPPPSSSSTGKPVSKADRKARRAEKQRAKAEELVAARRKAQA